MNRALSLFTLLPIANLVGAGCGGSGSDVAVGPAVDNPNPTSSGGHSNSTGAAGAGPAIVCTNRGCDPIAIHNICDSTRTTLLKDGLAPDDASNAMIQEALVTKCAPPPVATSVEKGTPGLVDLKTGRPLVGPDNLLTIAGGAYVQKTVEYLDLIGATPIYLVATTTPGSESWQYISRAPGGPVVAELPQSNFSPTHDIFLIELVRDPTSGTPVLIAFGQEAESTAAAAWYVANQMIPNRASYDKNWYVYEWTAASAPGAPASYVLKGSGP